MILPLKLSSPLVKLFRLEAVHYHSKLHDALRGETYDLRSFCRGRGASFTGGYLDLLRGAGLGG